MPRCKFCSNLYKPARAMQPGRVCNDPECQAKFALETIEKQRKKRMAAERVASVADRKIVKEKLARLRPGYLEGKAQDAINEYVRIRDYEQGCISCDRPATWSGQWHASHLKSRGANSFLRYNLWNIHKACSICNKHNSGNVSEYERRVAKKIGKERLDYIKNAPRSRRYDDDYLIRLAAVFRKKTRMLKNRKGLK